MNRPPRPAVALGLVLATAGALAGCTGNSTPAVAPGTTSTPSTSSSTPAPVRHVTPHNPYTGLGRVPTTPTIAVKIDDTAPGRPQLGIDKADIVYIEAAEGGLTRLAAIFGSHKPRVGYVRSTRPSDPDLLLQYGKITEAYSGGAHDSLPRVHASGITSWSNDAGARFYARVSRSESSYINLVLDTARVAKAVHTPTPHTNGWTFANALTGVRTRRGDNVRVNVTGSYPASSGTPVQFRWAPRLHAYVRYIDGQRQVAADGHPVTATNVIVQSCRIVAHPQDTDVDGNPSQFTFTVGSGPVSVFRDGKRINGTWSRKHLTNGTTLTAFDGRPIPLRPGNTWVVLARKSVPVLG